MPTLKRHIQGLRGRSVIGIVFLSDKGWRPAQYTLRGKHWRLKSTWDLKHYDTAMLAEVQARDIAEDRSKIFFPDLSEERAMSEEDLLMFIGPLELLSTCTEEK